MSVCMSLPWFWIPFCLFCSAFKVHPTITNFIIILLFFQVFHSNVSRWFLTSLSDRKFLQVSRTILSILADLNNAVVWNISTRPLIFMSSSPCTNPLMTVPRAPVHRHFHVPQFFQFSGKVNVLIFLFVFFQFYSMVNRDSKVHNSVSFFCFCFCFFIIINSGHLAEIKWFASMLKSQRNLCISFSRTDSGSLIYHLFVQSNFSFLHNS